MKIGNLIVLLFFSFVASSVGDAAAPPHFRAYLSAPQTITPGSPPFYVQVAWDRVAYDSTGWFDTTTGTWKPQASGTALCTWQVWDQAGVYNSQGYGLTAKLIGADYLGNNKSLGGISQDMAAVGTLGSYANTGQSALSNYISVDAGDVWKVSNYVKAASTTVTIDSNPAHTMWSCMFFAD